MLSVCLFLFTSADLTVKVSNDAVVIGEPVVCSVELAAVEGSAPTLSEEAFETGLGWFVLEVPSLRRDPSGALTLKWTVCALEPKPGPLPLPTLLQGGERLAIEGASVDVTGELANNEDAPRPARGFYIPAPAEQRATTEYWVIAQTVALSLGLAVWLLRRKRVSLEPVESSLAERLASLDGTVDGDDPSVVAWYGELTRILRAAYRDEEEGWSDEEWIERADLSAPKREELRELFGACAAVKYGGERPTRFASEEALARARELVSDAEEAAA